MNFNKILEEKIQKDPFLSGFEMKIEEEFKKKILKEILSFSSEISLDTIKDLLLLNKREFALNKVVDLIKNEKINAVIDDIEGIVIMKEKNPINELLEKSNNVMKNNLKDLIKYSLNKNIKHKFQAVKFHNLEGVEVKQIGIGMDHEIGNEFLMKMAMGFK